MHGFKQIVWEGGGGGGGEGMEREGGGEAIQGACGMLFKAYVTIMFGHTH